MPGRYVFRNVNVFDGERTLGKRTVTVGDGLVQSIELDQGAKSGFEVVEGEGRTLLPGLFDSHVHIEGEGSLVQSLAFGVTTVLDMFCELKDAVALRPLSRQRDRMMADFLTAGTLVTAPGGHGTEYGVAIPTINSPGEAEAFVDARIAEGSDYIKIVYDDGRVYARPFPTIDRETLCAVVSAAHRRGKMAMTHSLAMSFALDALQCGAEGLVHLFIDEPPSEGFIAAISTGRRFVIPTMTVLENVCGRPGGQALLSETDFRDYLSEDAVRMLMKTFSFPKGATPDYSVPRAAVPTLKRLKVPILAGSDAPNPGTAFGASVHRELQLLVDAGLTPEEALASATSVPAKVFGLHDRGKIAIGARADLLLVEGDPARKIEETREIVGVWRWGTRVERKKKD